jgi:hypothetical protein
MPEITLTTYLREFEENVEKCRKIDAEIKNIIDSLNENNLKLGLNNNHKETKNNNKIVTVYHYDCKFKFTDEELKELDNSQFVSKIYPPEPIDKK